MAHVVEEVQPRQWLPHEAYASGQGGYRIKVELSGNPFKGSLGDQWVKGWKDASASDTTSTKRVDYAALEDRYDRRPRSGGKDRNSTNTWRPGRTPRER